MNELYKKKYIKYKKKYLNIIKGGRLPLNVILECKFKTQTQESESGEPLTPRIPEFMFTCNNKFWNSRSQWFSRFTFLCLCFKFTF